MSLNTKKVRVLDIPFLSLSMFFLTCLPRKCEFSVDPHLLSWRVVDAGEDPGGFSSCVGASATGVLGYLEGYRFDDLYDDYDGGGEETVIEMDAVDEIAEIGFFCVGVLWDCMDEDDDWCLVGQA